MSMSQQMGMDVGLVHVFTTDGRGVTPEELAERAVKRIIYISENAPPVIRQQAEAFRTEIYHALVGYLHEAVRGYKSTLAVQHPELVPLLDL